MTVGSSCIELRRDGDLSIGSASFALRVRQESDCPWRIRHTNMIGMNPT
jgi:hypothetical protein